MRDSSNDSSWSCSCNSSKEGLENEMLLEKPLHRFTTHSKEDGSHWVRRGKKMLIPLNCMFLVLNALVWLFVLGKQPASTWGAFGGLKSRLGAPQVFSPSPAQEAVEHELHRFHGVGSDESEFNQPASDKLDSIWHELIDNGKWFAIDREMFVEINGNPDTGLRIPNDPQGRYLGMLQVNHQLHCVDVVRRATWYNIDRYRSRDMFGKMSDEDVIIHTNHCLEILRQTIKCHGDTAMLTYNWVHGHDWPQSAWRSLHSCQNWDRLNEWRSTHDISDMVTHLERPSWVLDRNANAPGRTGAAEAVKPITCRDLDCSVPEDSS